MICIYYVGVFEFYDRLNARKSFAKAYKMYISIYTLTNFQKTNKKIGKKLVLYAIVTFWSIR